MPRLDGGYITGRLYLNMSESTIGRRLREMVGLGMITSQRREGKNFKEFGMVSNPAVSELLHTGGY